MKLFLTMRRMSVGTVIEVVSYDAGAREDIPTWCNLQGQELLKTQDEGLVRHYFIRRTDTKL